MIGQDQPILCIRQPCETAVPIFVERLQRLGLSVLQTFDLHETRAEAAACTCQNHGTEKCDCQMVVLLIYGMDIHPVSLIAHGHNGQTWFSLVEYLGSGNADLEAQICSAFFGEGDLAS